MYLLAVFTDEILRNKKCHRFLAKPLLALTPWTGQVKNEVKTFKIVLPQFDLNIR
jgi:hypothetical protein